MRKIILYQCVPAYKPLPSCRLIQSVLNHSNCKILLDLEDSIQDIIEPSNTSFLKEKARSDLLEITHHFKKERFCVRINSINSHEFNRDIELLELLKGRIYSVFIPKIECADDVEKFRHETHNRFAINFIIETRKGYDNVNNILNIKCAKSTKFVFFGNYDYHLDSGIYPVNEQISEEYWNVVEPLIVKIEEKGFFFGNSPNANIGDTASLKYSFDRLIKLCKRSFALMSLHKSQTIITQDLIKGSNRIGNYFSPVRNEELIEEFITHKLKGRSFAFDPINKRIITPQEHLLFSEKKYE